MEENQGAMSPAIVVTGASSGIGRAIARITAREKSFLLLVGRSHEALGDLVAELERDGARAAGLAVDLLDPHALERIECALSERGLYCDVLVNSAGFGVFGPAAKLSRAEQLQLLHVNIRALTELTLRFLPEMVARGRGGILNVGSITGYVAGPKMAVYFASKSYVNSFSAALASEVTGTGVTVTCLVPGVVRTAFFDRCSVGQTRLMKLMPRSESHAHGLGRLARLQGRKAYRDSETERSSDHGVWNVVAGEPRLAIDELSATSAGPNP